MLSTQVNDYIIYTQFFLMTNRKLLIIKRKITRHSSNAQYTNKLTFTQVLHIFSKYSKIRLIQANIILKTMENCITAILLDTYLGLARCIHKELM
jgi:hypothetical protein